jgi:hypothetical protein
MTNTVVLNEFFIWEEKNLIGPKMKSKNNGVIDQVDITKNTRILNESENWKDITDPKLRKKMRLKEKDKRYREKHKDKIKLKKQVYQKVNKDKIKAYRETNKEKRKAYRIVNRNKINEYHSNRIKTDIQFKIRCGLRNRFSRAVQRNTKAGSAVRDLGCTIEELKSYLESKFLSGMSWDNWTADGWHIDHIKPLASFDLTDKKQMLEACHYTNLQPLWAKDNLAKSDKII